MGGAEHLPHSGDDGAGRAAALETAPLIRGRVRRGYQRNGTTRRGFRLPCEFRAGAPPKGLTSHKRDKGKGCTAWMGVA